MWGPHRELAESQDLTESLLHVTVLIVYGCTQVNTSLNFFPFFLSCVYVCISVLCVGMYLCSCVCVCLRVMCGYVCMFLCVFYVWVCMYVFVGGACDMCGYVCMFLCM